MKKRKRDDTKLAGLDGRMSALLQGGDDLVRPEAGWLRAVRESLGVSQRTAATAAGVTQQAFDQFEAGERKGTITLERFQKAAAALGCEVVYFLKPAGAAGDTFSALADRRAPEALTHPVKRAVRSQEAPQSSEDLPVNLL